MDIYDQLSLILIKNDCSFIKDLFFFTKNKNYNSILLLDILPFISLILYESNTFLNKNILNIEKIIPQNTNNSYSIKDVRLKLKLFTDTTPKNIRMIKNIEYINDRYFKELDGTLSYKNIGIYTDKNKNIIGNTHLAYFFCQFEELKTIKLKELKEIYNTKILKHNDMETYSLNYGFYLGQLASFFNEILIDFPSNIVHYKDINYRIQYQDFNTFRDTKIFPIDENERITKLYILHLLSMVNSILYFLKPIIYENLLVLIKFEYIVYYYVVKSLNSLYKYLEKNNLINSKIIKYYNKFNLNNKDLFNSDFRSCMMHYGFKNPKNNEPIINIKLDLPYFGLIEHFFNMNISDFEYELHNNLTNISNILKTWLNLPLENTKLL